MSQLPPEVYSLIDAALTEDETFNDPTTGTLIPDDIRGIGMIRAKADGVLAGLDVARAVFHRVDPDLEVQDLLPDGSVLTPGTDIARVDGLAGSILRAERIALNFMQRMSGVATITRSYVDLISHTDVKLLDTRKTTPGLRKFEKEAVKLGGGVNHRFGLYDMVMLKDNHIDYAGGLEAGLERTKNYLRESNLDLKIEVEVRDRKELDEVLEIGGVDRIMLDNFTPEEIIDALKIIPDSIETEASGGITKETIVAYAETGVDFISVGALTHSAGSLDLSLKAHFD